MNLFQGWRRTVQSDPRPSDLTTKASRMGPLVALHHVGQPIQTPRQYDRLAIEGYQSNSMVYRCVTLIARSVASVPLILYKGEERQNHHPLLRVMRHPSPHESGAAFLESVVSYLLLSGNSYIECVRDIQGVPQELYALRPDRCRVVPSENGSIARYEYHLKGQKRAIPVDPETGQSDVMHLKLFHPLNDWYGMSPLEAAGLSIDQYNTVSKHNLALLQNGGRPSGALVMNQDAHHGLTASQRTQLREDVRGLYEGATNAGKILLLEGDFQWREMGLSPKDLDFTEGRHHMAREIAQAFGVPPMLVGVPGDATFANYKEARFHLWEDTVLPLLNMILDELNVWLSSEFGDDFVFKYDLDDIPALSSRRESLWHRLETCTFLSDNEKRKLLGFEARAVEGEGQ